MLISVPQIRTDSLELFRESYRELSGNLEPFPWQEELFLRFCKCEIPKDIALPTGCGKTSVMAVWLLALAYQARNGPEGVSLPRRLVWVVNRRVVVDQATHEAEELKRRISDKSRNALELVRVALKQLSAKGTADDDLIGISTLRGQFADNAEWRDHPARPAIVVGTIDMIGSRLLFSGYGSGFKSRPLHAGFIGQDALLIHDEAHLEPAFQHVIEAVTAEQTRCREFRQFRVVALTATSRAVAENVFGLTKADRSHTEIRQRITASKGAAFHAVDDEKRVAAAVFQMALEFKDSGDAILIFLRKVDDVQEVVGKLRKHDLRAGELTGTMRGYERDRMVNTGIFTRFVPNPGATPSSGTVYLVCTSAGEVGVNMSADHLVCDLTPFDSMTQRFGRVNRFGRGDARIEIVYADGSKVSLAESELNQRRERTLALLQRLPQRLDGRFDASPSALESLPADERQAAFTPLPTILPVSEVLFDAWALTSIREKMPGRPPVADWLHGVAEDWEPPQTYVAWRDEVDLIRDDLLIAHPPEDLLGEFPLKPHELLRDTSRRVSEHLARIAERLPDLPTWVVESGGSISVRTLGDFMSRAKAKKDVVGLSDCTVLLPPEAGGLNAKGILDGEAPFEDTRDDYDVADKWPGAEGRPRRCRLWDPDEAPSGMRLVRVVDTNPGSDEELDNEQTPTRRYWRWYVRPQSADDEGSRTARREQEWDMHTSAVERIAGDLVATLGLKDPEASAVVCAAKWHDLGKRRERWQRSIGNHKFPERVLAKSDPKALGFRIGYRHELGSLIDVAKLPEFLCLTPDLQDLVQHFIAAHHGRARPHFAASEVFDPESTYEQALAAGSDVPRRFARLQRKYGRWGLAYLESLVRASDALASQEIDSAKLATSGVGQ